jgi:PIN domain nuclease of toxin-antitoxin system
VGVSYLVDTHILIWLVGLGNRPSPDVETTLASAETTLFVSAVSSFEIATKVRRGKLDEARDLHDHWALRLRELRATELPISAEHGRRAGSLAWPHRDPFDRLLVAQAQCDNLTLVTADRAVLAAPDVQLLPW